MALRILALSALMTPAAASDSNPMSKQPSGSGPVFISPYLTKKQIEESPSRTYFLRKASGDVDGAREKENITRRLTCAFLQECGQKLRLPQLSIATAIVFFHRFYARMSYEHYDRFTVATTCLFLASKVEETPKKLKDVVMETYKTQHNQEKAPEPETKEFFELKEKILVCERILLQALGFDLSVEHAYRPLLAYVKSIKGTRDLAQIAWNFINDSFRTTICLQYAPRHLAAAAAHMSARYLETHNKRAIVLPDHQSGGKWYASFQTDMEIIDDIKCQIFAMYREKGQNNNSGGLSEATLHHLMSDKGEHGSSSAAPAADAAAPSPSAAPAVTATPSQPAEIAIKPEPKAKAEEGGAPTARENGSSLHDAPGGCKRGQDGAGLEDGPLDGAPDAKRSRSDGA